MAENKEEPKRTIKTREIIQSITNKTWKKILIGVVAFIFIPWLWWLYLILVIYWAVKNWRVDKKKVIKRLSVGTVAFFVLGTLIVYVNNAYGALLVNSIPTLTNQKTIKIEGTSSYKDGKIFITGAKADKTIPIDGNGKFSVEVELNENANNLLIEPTNKDGKKGWTKGFKLTLDTIAPNLDVDSLNPETESEKIEIKGKTESGATVKLFRDDKEIGKLLNIKSDTFSFKNVKLSEGDNKFKVVASDKAGNEQKKELAIKYTPKKVEQKKEDSNQSSQTTTPAPATKMEEPKQDASKALDAEVRYNATAFQIKNNESKDWTGCRFTINIGWVSGWVWEGGIKANDTVIIPYRDFTKGDGTRFDSYPTKVKDLTMSCYVVGTLRTAYFAMPN